MLESQAQVGAYQRIAIYHPAKDEYLYAGVPTLDYQRRYVLSWIPKDGDGRPNSNPITIWNLYYYPAGGYYGIKNEYANEWLFAGESMAQDRRLALTWIGIGDPESDDTMRWSLNPVGSTTMIRNIKLNEYLYLGTPKLDSTRRLALTWKAESSLMSDPDLFFQIKYV